MKKVLRLFRNKVFIYFCILNLVSNLAELYYAKNAWYSILVLSFASAFVEAVVCNAIPIKRVRNAFVGIVALLHNTLIITDYYLIFKFQRIINEDVIDILAETNKIEIQNFLASYLHWYTIPLVLCLVFIINFLILSVAKFLQQYRICYLSSIFVIYGLGLYAYAVMNFVKFGNGMSVPQHNAVTRAAYSYYVMRNRVNQISVLYKVNQATNAKSNTETPPSIVVVIGESHSIFHSQLYGYEKSTNPLLQKRVDKGEMIVFNNVVSVEDATHGAMKSVFSLDSLGTDFLNYPLFPVCFRLAGYTTSLYDNEYFVGRGINFLSDKALSEQMFIQRNEYGYKYDGELVDDVEFGEEPFLCVIHLWGQHYTYAERFPSEFQVFEKEMYDKERYSSSQREVIANYDNATLYNDFVLDKIIDKIENKNCCLIYFSDHGEEVFECRDYMGHGNAEHSPNIDYQIRVPLFIWASSTFREQYAGLFSSVEKAKDFSVITDDISHLLLDIAQIETKKFNPTRSVVNDKYNLRKHRIVLNSIDYDDSNH